MAHILFAMPVSSIAASASATAAEAATAASPVHSEKLTALLLFRLLQPSAILAIAILSTAWTPTVHLIARIFAPDPTQIRAATTRYGTPINGSATGLFPATSSSSRWNQSQAAGQALPSTSLAGANDETQEPTPVIVPVRSRRRELTFIILSALAASYFLSGTIVVLRAVIPPRFWIPSRPEWQAVDWQALLGLLAWSSVAIACAFEETLRGRGKYGRGKAFWSILVGLATDLIIVYLFLSVRHLPIVDLPKRQLWFIGQLAVIGARVILLYPLALIALRWDKTTFIRASELASREGATAGGQAEEAIASTETTALLHPNRANASGPSTTSYGTTDGLSTGPKTTLNAKVNGNGLSNGGGSGTRSPNPNAANASMGLTVSAPPPPPTFTVFFQRVRILFPYLWPSQSLHLQLLALFCVALLMIGRLVNLFVPLTLGRIVSDLSDGRAPWLHIFAYAGLKVLQGSGGILAVLQALAWLPIEQFSDRSLSLMAFDHLLHLSMAFHTRRKMGEILRILDRGAVISTFFQYLIFNVVPIFVDIAVAMIYLGTTFGWTVGLAIFSVMYLYTTVSVKLTTWRTALRRDANNKDSISRAIHADVLINYELVKVHSNEPYELDRYRAALLDYQEADYRVTSSLNLLNLVQNGIITVGTLVTCLIVANSVVTGKTSPSDFVVFITYLQQVYVPLAFLGTLHRVLMQNLVDTDKLMNLLEEESDVKDLPEAKDLIVTEGVIEFRDVVFSYDGKVDALKGVNFKIKMNESAALVGESGAGKSSIMRLLYRFYDIQQGQILIDGQDISKVTQASLRRAIGIVPQEPGLFNTSIYQNILYGNVNASDEEVEAAAKAAQIYDRIQSFPEGWKTVVGERGVKLSGGEKQRVALARTFLKNPKILLLDEATSALDTHTEKQLQIALRTILQGRTSLTIAHRLSTIVNSDRIVVLDNGRVVEDGSHVDLVAKNGLYKSMWMQQIKTDEEARQAAKDEEVTQPELPAAEPSSITQGAVDTSNTIIASLPSRANDKKAGNIETSLHRTADQSSAPPGAVEPTMEEGKQHFTDTTQAVQSSASKIPEHASADVEQSAVRNKTALAFPSPANGHEEKPSATDQASQGELHDASEVDASLEDLRPTPSATAKDKETLRRRITSMIRSRGSGNHDRTASTSSSSHRHSLNESSVDSKSKTVKSPSAAVIGGAGISAQVSASEADNHSRPASPPSPIQKTSSSQVFPSRKVSDASMPATLIQPSGVRQQAAPGGSLTTSGAQTGASGSGSVEVPDASAAKKKKNRRRKKSSSRP